MPDVYETILNLPECWLETARPDGHGGWDKPEAPLRIIEGDLSAESRPLFDRVLPDVFAQHTVAALIELLDNYHPHEGAEDVTLEDSEHRVEVERFLDVIMDTPALRVATAYLRQADPNHFPDDASVRAWTLQVWFEPFTNEYAAPEPFCSGFEHVFVGEVQQNAQPGDNKMDIGGYHSWVKYARDQAAGAVGYLGHDYRPEVAELGKGNPREASVIMTWTVEGVEYLKNPGGFFVGDLPEMQIALGIVGVFDSIRGQFGVGGASGKSTDRKVAFGSELIDLVVYPQTIKEGGQNRPGPHLRSMYPKYRGTGQSHGSSQPHTPHNEGPLRIRRALPNPEGPTDETGEWVEIINATQQELALEGWTLRDGQQRQKALTGLLASGDAKRVPLARTGPAPVQLTNSGGWIYLYQGDERVAAVRYPSASTGQIFDFF